MSEPNFLSAIDSASIARTLSEFQPLSPDDIADEAGWNAAWLEMRDACFREGWRVGIETALVGAYGPKGSVLADLLLDRVGSAYETAIPAQTRQATSKLLCKIRRNLGLPIAYPKKARCGSRKRSKNTNPSTATGAPVS